MRRIRRAVELGLPIVGVVLVLAAVLFFYQNLYVQIAIVLLGLVLIEAGIWNLASPVLPSERRFMALRREVDGFILLVRRLNRATLELASEPTPQHRAKLLQVRDEMLESVRRMEQVAGQADDGSAHGSAMATASPAAVNDAAGQATSAPS